MSDEERKPYVLSEGAVRLPTEEELAEMEAKGERIPRPEPGTFEYDLMYRPYVRRERIANEMKAVIDAALARGAIGLDEIGTFLDGLKRDYHTALHRMRREGAQPYTPRPVRILSTLRKVRSDG